MGRDDASQLILLRFSGDITIKARGTRFQFVRRLLSNLRDALASEGVAPRIQLSHNRMLIEVADAAVMPALARVFGVQSLSPVERRVPTQLAAIVAAGVECFRERVAGKRFAVRARRVGDRAQIGVSAHAVEVELGAALLPFAAGVDLDAPELTVGVELLERETYLFCERVPGLGGLPLGVEGRAIALFSGGFDSAVAAWYLLKRGVALDYVFCNLGGETHLQGVLRVARILASRWSYGDRPAFHVVDFSAVVADLQARAAKRFWQVLLKRLLLRAAERIAATGRAVAIVTGDAVGQVSSQTLQNLAVISRATPEPILRPLVGFNKDEIIAVAEKIGTVRALEGGRRILRSGGAASGDERGARRRRSRGGPPRPGGARARGGGAQGPRPARPRGEPARLPRARDRAHPAGRHRDRPEPARPLPELALGGRAAPRLPAGDAAFPSFDATRRYVLYCEYGLQSAFLAEQMRKAGLNAFHVRGGSRTLKRQQA